MAVLTDQGLRSHVAIVGRTGSGKSYTAKGVVEQILRQGKAPVCIIDPGGDWWGLRASADGKRAGLQIAVLGGDHADVPITPHSGAEVAEFVATKGVSCVVDVSEWIKSDQIRFMIAFAETIYRLNRQPLHLVLDEADQFSPQNPLSESKKLLNRMEVIVRLGRKRGFRVMMITQRPAILHKNVLTQANSLIVLQMTSPQDRKAIEAWIDGNADAAEAKVVLKSLARMPQGEGWVWEPQMDRLERVKFPKIRTFDAGSTPDDGPRAEPKTLAQVDIGALKEAFAVSDSEPSNEVEKIAVAKRTSALEAEHKTLRVAHDTLVVENKKLREYAETLKSQLEAGNAERLEQVTLLTHISKLASGKTPRAISLSGGREFVPDPPEPMTPIPSLATKRTTPPATTISSGAVVLLTGYAGMYPRWCTAKQAATRAGQSVRSSAFRPNQKHLVDGGLIESNGSSFRATEQGLSITGTDVLRSGASISHWTSRLPGSQAALLTAIKDHGPIDKLEAARLADISATSSGLGSGLKSLVDLALIERDHNNRYNISEGLTE